MTQTIGTSDLDLMRVGDTCTFVEQQGYKPEYHITVGKVYTGIVSEIGYNYANCTFENDVGETAAHAMVLGGHAGNSATITVIISTADYRYRVHEAHAKSVGIIENEHNVRMDKLKVYYNKRLSKLTETV